MAGARTMKLIEQATDFFSAIASAPAAGAPVAPYPVELMITTPQERFTVQFNEGRPSTAHEVASDAETGYWTLELCAERPVFEGIFAGALTMGEALYAGILVAPEEKSKHNLTPAIGQTIRLVQEAHRRARDPRHPGA